MMNQKQIAELAFYAVLLTAVTGFAYQRRQSCPLRQPVAAPAAATSPAVATSPAKIETISPQRARDMMKAGAKMVDVREPAEWENARVENSVLVPLAQVKAEPQKAAVGPQVLLMCQSGRRARIAADAMSEVPGVQLFVIEGGIARWQAEGLPVQQGQPANQSK